MIPIFKALVTTRVLSAKVLISFPVPSWIMFPMSPILIAGIDIVCVGAALYSEKPKLDPMFRVGSNIVVTCLFALSKVLFC